MKTEPIVVTGSIGSGKSFVLDVIRKEAKVPVSFFSFDEFTKELYQREDVQNFLMVMFGTTDRAKISDMVFKSPAMRDSLNDFFFSHVEEKFLQLVNERTSHGLVIEFPLYFEVKNRSDAVKLARNKVKVLAVVCDDAVRKSRIKFRDGISDEKINAILESQVPQEYKIENADYVIDNTNGNCINHVRDLMKTKFKKVFYSVDS